MKINGFSHVNVRTAQLEEMIAWYGDILDMHPGPRPDFSFGGAWLYAGDNPFIHLVKVADAPQTREPRIEHYALDARGIPYSIDPVPGFPLVQINCYDPDGNHIHIDFSRKDAEDAGLV